MEKRDKMKSARKKRIANEYNSTKCSPDYYKGQAISKLERIVKENPSHDRFVSYIRANPHKFLDDELKEIKSTLENLMESEKNFIQWTRDHLANFD